MIAERRVFVDTNVLIYVRDPAAGDKTASAARWLRMLAARQSLVVNLQVLNELTRWVLRNERVPVATARQRVDELRRFGEAALQPSHVAAAWSVREKLGYQWFDCLLIAWASEEGCSHFLSEDMAHETRYGDLTIINPFRVDPDAFLKAN
ncbi:PIN domain-containing protein [Bosea sp. 124]|uniref:PIN domain-containing protein n=1 Tax=Bosea sp. 124 TaxID=2135642 RepID=UPI000D42D7AA|nr:PIN domain-containing protein [Bosea sp. 124]PTM41926.1 putative nucleic acid-binding protein [Bosea sp. 124]